MTAWREEFERRLLAVSASDGSRFLGVSLDTQPDDAISDAPVLAVRWQTPRGNIATTYWDDFQTLLDAMEKVDGKAGD